MNAPQYKPMPDDLRVIAGMPCVASMQIGYVPYKGSVIKPCCQCGTACWVGPESWKLAESLRDTPER